MGRLFLFLLEARGSCGVWTSGCKLMWPAVAVRGRAHELLLREPSPLTRCSGRSRPGGCAGPAALWAVAGARAAGARAACRGQTLGCALAWRVGGARGWLRVPTRGGTGWVSEARGWWWGLGEEGKDASGAPRRAQGRAWRLWRLHAALPAGFGVVSRATG